MGHCSRTHCVVEPFLSEQWFVRAGELSSVARHVVETGTVRFVPESWTKTYLHWLSIIEDWCISRQLWWGHRIPAWYCSDCDFITVPEKMAAEKDVTQCEKCQSQNLRQEEDVLDTWFSSALWPFSTMGWPEETETIKTFYPTSTLVTGHDIIFFWVARMVMMGLEFKGDVPFRDVYIHGLIRDAQGQKMSKSLNNSVDPIDLIDEFGADALRFTLMSQLAAGRDIKFSKQRLEGYRNFMNKIWNATRFSLKVLENFEAPQESLNELPDKNNLSDADQWIIHKIGLCEEEVNNALEQYQFSEAAHAIYHFAWHEFCDWYLELIKPIVYGEDQKKKAATQRVLAQCLNRLLRLLHPFAPFITEELYQQIPLRGEALIVDEYPSVSGDKAWLGLADAAVVREMDLVCEVIKALRNIRGENKIKPGLKIEAWLVPSDDFSEKTLNTNRVAVQTLAQLKTWQVGEVKDFKKCAVTPVKFDKSTVTVVVPLEGLVDFDEEIKRIEKTATKLNKEKDSLEKKLKNENFVKNAPQEVVLDGEKRLTELVETLRALKESLERLQ